MYHVSLFYNRWYCCKNVPRWHFFSVSEFSSFAMTFMCLLHIYVLGILHPLVTVPVHCGNTSRNHKHMTKRWHFQSSRLGGRDFLSGIWGRAIAMLWCDTWSVFMKLYSIYGQHTHVHLVFFPFWLIFTLRLKW